MRELRTKKLITLGVLITISIIQLFSQPLYWNTFDYPKYPWIDSTVNLIQTHNRQSIAPLMQKLKSTNKERVHILHIGDSHVQADIFTHEARTLLGGSFGYAGRGMVFPYTTARTHTAADYRCYHTGKWYYARNVERRPDLPLGVTGVTSKTYDTNAQFKLKFKEDAIREDYNQVKILCKRIPGSFDVRVIGGTDTVVLDIYSSPKDTLTDLITANFSRGYQEYLFEIISRDSNQKSFEIYGISIESDKNTGLLYTSVGINGAGHYSIMRENRLPQHLETLSPDAIILDIGANDFYRGGMNKEKFKGNLISILEMFKTYAPNALVILSNSQDILRGGYSVRACSIFSLMISEVAKSENVAFYDWYRVAGGNHSMKIWKSLHLANRDGVHLTRNGYELKGSLIYQAFGKTYKRFFNSEEDSFIIPCFDSTQVDSILASGSQKTADKQWINHKVVRGETAWGIAQRYNVSVIQIKEWNRLSSYALRPGQILKVHTDFDSERIGLSVKNPPSVSTKPVKIPHKNSTGGYSRSYRYHTIKRGETLYSIARKYRMSVRQLKRLNGLRSDFIRAGKRLKVK